LQRHPEVHLFNLPTYSPEYNPVERLWNWLKPKIYGFTSVGGKSELLSRFRKYIWHYNEGSLVKPINFKLETYADIL